MNDDTSTITSGPVCAARGTNAAAASSSSATYSLTEKLLSLDNENIERLLRQIKLIIRIKKLDFNVEDHLQKTFEDQDISIEDVSEDASETLELVLRNEVQILDRMPSAQTSGSKRAREDSPSRYSTQSMVSSKAATLNSGISVNKRKSIQDDAIQFPTTEKFIDPAEIHRNARRYNANAGIPHLRESQDKTGARFLFQSLLSMCSAAKESEKGLKQLLHDIFNMKEDEDFTISDTSEEVTFATANDLKAQIEDPESLFHLLKDQLQLATAIRFDFQHIISMLIQVYFMKNNKNKQWDTVIGATEMEKNQEFLGKHFFSKMWNKFCREVEVGGRRGRGPYYYNGNRNRNNRNRGGGNGGYRGGSRGGARGGGRGGYRGDGRDRGGGRANARSDGNGN